MPTPAPPAQGLMVSASPDAPAVPVATHEDKPAPVAIPDYAKADPAKQKGDVKGHIGLVLACVGIPAALLPIVGLGLGIAGLVLGLLARPKQKKLLSILTLVFAGLAILLALAAMGYNFAQYQKSQSGAGTGAARNTLKQDDSLGY